MGQFDVLPNFQFQISTFMFSNYTMRQLLDILIRIYQVTISPLLGDCCRFYPSCSAYCRAAIHKHGCFRGLTLGIIRLSKCHPFHPGGVDHVP
jgi:uncharacterized protein